MPHDLNPAQREAVETLSGPLLVLAGAGSGKTRVVTFRIARLIRSGIRPSRILAVTFTNKAANEMQDRVSALLGKRNDEKPEVSTFHSLCVRILRRQIRRLGYPEQFAIYDRGDQEGLARAALREIHVPGSTLRPGDLLWFIGQWKTASIRPARAASIAQTDKEHLAASAYRRYQNALKAAGAVDFDDLLLLTEELFSRFPKTRREEAARFDHLLIDEYQDTNGSQYRIVRSLAGGHRNLCVVGDDDQSIYGFRGAEVEHILHFKKDWPEAKIVQLMDNYRCTGEILAMANRLIKYNKTRYDKLLRAARPGGERPRILQFEDETAEAEQIVADIRRLISDPAVEPRDVAILFRTNEQPRAFEAKLREADLPYVLIGSMSFFDRKEVRDVLAFFKVLDHPRDEVSLLRIINTPPRGISQKTVGTLLERAVERGKQLWDVLPQAGKIPGIGPAAAGAIDRFTATIEQSRRQLDGRSLVDVCTELIAKVRYRAELERQYDDPNDVLSRWASVEEIINALGLYGRKNRDKATLGGFLADVALMGQDLENDKEERLAGNAIALMTLHSAKGLEFPYVYMVGMEEGFLPHHRSVKQDGAAIDEERRLCYVGITRAEERLTLSLALGRMKWGKPRPTHPSRFLFEITGQADNPNNPANKNRRNARRKKTSGTKHA